MDRFHAILSLLESRLSEAKRDSEEKMAGLSDIRRTNLPNVRNRCCATCGWPPFEDLVHLSQEFQNAADEEKDHESALQLIAALKKMAASPYFARIDLKFYEDEPAETGIHRPPFPVGRR
jgi:hypothetical protein